MAKNNKSPKKVKFPKGHVTIKTLSNILNIRKMRVRELCRAGKFEDSRKLEDGRWAIPLKSLENYKNLISKRISKLQVVLKNLESLK